MIKNSGRVKRAYAEGGAVGPTTPKKAETTGVRQKVVKTGAGCKPHGKKTPC